MSTEVQSPAIATMCPLLLAIGNCLHQNTCKHSHPIDLIKVKQKKALKLNKNQDAAFQPKEEPKAAEVNQIVADLDEPVESNFSLDLNQNIAHFHPRSKGCDCCKGFIYNCQGVICSSLGSCHCYAAELEEEQYNQNDDFFQEFANCNCCKGRINSCDGQVCQTLGMCYCAASKAEEQGYYQNNVYKK